MTHRRRILAATLGWLLMAGALAADEKRTYGDSLSSAQTIRIADLLAEPERWVDKSVKVEGLVDDVCPMKGCWIDILEQQSSTTVRFKVEDDVIVFPAEARGSRVVAEGVLRKHEMSKEQAISWLSHLADEKGESFDESSVTGPMDFFQIEGAGAEVVSP